MIQDILNLLDNHPYGIGGSYLLHHYGITESYNDLDICVDLEVYNQVIDNFRRHGKALSVKEDPRFKTKAFSSFDIKGIQVDLMGDFAIQHENGIFEVNVETPLMALEDWYVIYSLLNRNSRKQELQMYFKNHGINRERLKMLCKKELPESIKKELKEYYENIV